MQRFTDQGWQKIIELAQRYGVSTDAVTSLLQSVVNEYAAGVIAARPAVKG